MFAAGTLAEGSLEPSVTPALTNVAQDMAAMTSVLFKTDWGTIQSMAGDMASITGRIGSVNWGDIATVLAATSNQTAELGNLAHSISNGRAGLPILARAPAAM